MPARNGPRNRRYYSQQDVDRLSLLKALVDAGHPISSVALLSERELRARLEASSVRPAAASQRGKGPCRIIVMGSALSAKLTTFARELSNIEIVGSFQTVREFDESAQSLSAAVLLLEYTTIQPSTLAHVRARLARAGAKHAVVVYGFGTRESIRGLERTGVLCLEAPVSAAQIQWACATVIESPVVAASVVAKAPNTIPVRRFSADQLARLAVRTSTVKCECPHHLVDLINKLLAFETYSSECQNLNTEDREMHSLLHGTTATARAQLEGALAKLIEYEGVSPD